MHLLVTASTVIHANTVFLFIFLGKKYKADLIELCLKSQGGCVHCYMEQSSVTENLGIKSPAFHVNISQRDHDNTCAEKGGLGPSNYIPCEPPGFNRDSRMNRDTERAIVFKDMFVYKKCHLHLTFRGRLQSIN